MHNRGVTGRLLALAALLSGCRLIDAAGGADPDATCAPAALLSDDFEDGVMDPAWETYSDPGAAAEEVDGVLRVVYSGAAEAWAGYRTAEVHDLRGGSLAAEVARVGGDTIIELNDGETKVQTYAQNGTLYGTVIVAGETLSEFETDYLPAEHAHWRMREEDGVVHWETSPGGEDWSELDARPTSLAADAVTLLLSGGGIDGDQPAEFESVAIAVADAGCPAAARAPR